MLQRKWFTFMFLFLAMAGLCFGFEQAASAAPAAAAAVAPAVIQIPGLPPINLGSSWWAGILMGVFASLQAIVVGYVKNRDPLTGKLPAFDWTVAAETVGVGVVLGVVAHFIKWAPQDLASWLQATPIGGFIVTGTESLLNLIFRHGVPALKGALDLYKGGSTTNPPLPPDTKPQ